MAHPFGVGDGRSVGRFQRWTHTVRQLFRGPKPLQGRFRQRFQGPPGPSISESKLGRSIAQSARAPSPRLLFEPLEPRLLLSADPFTYIAASDESLDFTLRLYDDDGVASMQLLDNGVDGAPAVAERALAEIGGIYITGSSVDDTLTLDIDLAPDSSWLDSTVITFDGRGGADALTGSSGDTTWHITSANAGQIDTYAEFLDVEQLIGAADNQDRFVLGANATLDGGVDGGDGGFDTLDVLGTYDNATFTASGPTSGAVILDGETVYYDGLEPVNLGLVTNVEIDFGLLTLASDDSAELTESAGVFTFQSTDVSPTFELVTFDTGFDSLTIDMGTGNDTVNIAADVSMSGNFTVIAESITIGSGVGVTSTGGDINLTAASDVDSGLAASVVVDGALEAAGEVNVTASVDMTDSESTLDDFTYTASATADVNAALTGDVVTVAAEITGVFSVLVDDASILDDGDTSVTATHTAAATVAGGVTIVADTSLDVTASDASSIRISYDPAEEASTLTDLTELDLSDASSSIDFTRTATATVGDETNGNAVIAGAGGTNSGVISVAASIADSTGGGTSGSIDSELYGQHVTTASDTVTASVINADINTDGLSVTATNAATYTAIAKVAENTVTGGTSASILGSDITAAGATGVNVTASDTAVLTATSTEFQLDPGALTFPLELGSASAVNDIVRSVSATIDDSTANPSEISVTTGAVSVSATSDIQAVAFADAQILDSGGVQIDPIEITLGGTIATNIVGGDVTASIADSSVETDGGVSVEATNDALITATARTGSATGGALTGTGSGAFAWNAVGIEIESPSAASVGEGFGDVVVGTDLLVVSNGGNTTAFIADSDVSTDGDILVQALSAPAINATVTNAAESTADALFGAGGIASVAVSGAIAANRTNTAARAYVETDGASLPETIAAGGDITINAEDDAGIFSNSKLVSSSITSSDGGANLLGAAIDAFEQFDYETDGVDVFDADGNTVAVAQTLQFGDRVRLTVDFTGTGAAGRVFDYVGPSDGNLDDLTAQDYGDLDFWKPQTETTLIPQGNNFLPSNSLSYGGVFVRNEVTTDVEARLSNVAASTDLGDIAVTATSDAEIIATADTDAESSGGNVFGQGTSTANNGVVATNGILSRAVALVEDSTLDTGTAGVSATGNLTVAAANNSIITATNSTAVSTGSESVGVMLAYNTIGYESRDVLSQGVDALIDAFGDADPATVTARIIDSQLNVLGNIAVTATNSAELTATVNTAATSAAAALYGADGINTSFVLASNLVATDVEASMDNVDERNTAGDPPLAGGSVTVAATDSAVVNATTSMEAQASETNTLGFSIVDTGVSTILQDYQFTTASGTATMSFGDQVRIGATVADADPNDDLEQGDIFRHMGEDGDIVDLTDGSIYADFGEWQRVDEFNALGSIGKGVRTALGLSEGTAKNRFGLIARNDIDARTDAFIDDSVVRAGDAITVSATERAHITAFDNSTIESASDTTGSGSKGGVITNNQLLSKARAYVTDSELSTASGSTADITVEAFNLSVLDARSLTEISGAQSISLVAAFNSFGWNAANIFFNAFDTLLGTEIAIDERPVEAKAFVENSDLVADGDIFVTASTTEQLFTLGDGFAQLLDDLSIQDRDDAGDLDPIDEAQDASFLFELQFAFAAEDITLSDETEVTLLATASEWLVDDKAGDVYLVKRDGDSLNVLLTSILDVQVGNEAESNVVNDRVLVDAFKNRAEGIVRDKAGTITDLKFGASGIAAGGIFSSNRASVLVDAYIDTGTDFSSADTVSELEAGDRVDVGGTVYEYIGADQRVDGSFTFASSSEPDTISPADATTGAAADRVKLLEDTASASAGDIYEYIGSVPLSVDFSAITADHQSDMTPDTLERGETVELATDVGGGTAGEILRYTGETLSNLFDFLSTVTDADIATGERVQVSGTTEVYEYLGDDVEDLNLATQDYADEDTWRRVDFDLAAQDYTSVEWELVGIDLTAIDYTDGDWLLTNAPLAIDLSNAVQAYATNTATWELVGTNPSVSITAGGVVNVGADDSAVLIATSELDISSAATNNIDAVFNLINQAAIPNGYVYTTESGQQTVEDGDTIRIGPNFTDGSGSPSAIAGRVFQYGAGDSPLDDLSVDLGTLTESDFLDDSVWTDITASATSENVVSDFFPNIGNLSNSDSRAMGGIVVFNDLRADTDARIEQATVVAGDVSVTAIENATLLANTDTNVSSSGGSAFGTGTSIAINGILASNVVLSQANAIVVNSDLDSSGNVSVQAMNTARMDATTNAQTSTGDTSIAGVYAFNTVGWKAQNILFNVADAYTSGDPLVAGLFEGEETSKVSATIIDSDVAADGDVRVTAESTAIINATTSNVNESAASALINATGLAAGVMVSTNKVNSAAEAYIDNTGAGAGEAIDAGGSVIVSAADNAGIYANNRMDTQSSTSNDGGVAVLQETLNDLIPADWVAGNTIQTINLRFNDLVRLENDFAGDGDGGQLYVYLGDDATGVDLAAEDYTNLDFWKPQFFSSIFPMGNNVTDSDSIGVGSTVVLNDLRSDVDAYIESATVDAGDGDVDVTAIESATINATIDSTVTSSGGSALGAGTSLAINGSIASNILLSDADAYVANSTVTAVAGAGGGAGAVNVSATNSSLLDATNNSITNTGDTGVGLQLAFNTVGWQPTNALFQALEALIGDPLLSDSAFDREDPASASAYIDGSTVTADGDVTVSASTDASIVAATSNQTSSSAGAFTGASGMAIGGVVTSSKVSTDTQAYIATNADVASGGSVVVQATDAANVTADNEMIATSETVNSGGLNLFTGFLDQLAGEYNFTSNSGVRDIQAGDRVRLASDFAGAGGIPSTDEESSVYLYEGDDLEGVNLATNDYNGSDWVRFDVDNITDYIPDQLNFNVSSSNSIGIGGLIVFNDVRGAVEARIDSSAVDAASDVAVTATEDATITAMNVSEAQADGGSVFTSGLSLAIAGTLVTNQVFSAANATIIDSTIGSAVDAIGGDVTVSAGNTATISATTNSALTVFGGGNSIAVGATIAFNRLGVASYLVDALDSLFDTSSNAIVGNPASATAQVDNSDIYADGAVDVRATNDTTIDATIENAAFASSFSIGGGNDTAISISPVIAFNRLASDTDALINASDTIVTGGDVMVTAVDQSSIVSSNVLTSVSLAVGTNQSVSASVGLTFALNEVDNHVTARVVDSSLTGGDRDVIVSASQNASILSTGVAASVAGSAGTGATFGFSAAGAIALNEILGGADASIEGSVVSANNVVVTSDNASDIDALIAAASAAISFAVGADAVAGSIGISVADNRIGYAYDDNRIDTDANGVLTPTDMDDNGAQTPLDVQAFLLDSQVSASGDITLDAQSEAVIDATIIAASAALAASTSGSTVTLSAAGAVSNNQVSTRVRAFISGDGDPTSGPGISARNINITAEDASAISTVAAAASLSGSAGIGNASGAVSVGAAIALNEIANDTQAFILNADDGVTTTTTFSEGAGTQTVAVGDTIKLAEDSTLGDLGAVYEYIGAGGDIDLDAVDYNNDLDWQVASADIVIAARSGTDPLFQFTLTDFSIDELNDAADQAADDFSTDGLDESFVDAVADAGVLNRLVTAFSDEGIDLTGSPDATSRDVTIYSTGKGNDWAVVDRLGLNFNIRLNPLTGQFDVYGTSINAVAAAASVAAGFSTGTGVGVSGAGAFSDNVILGTTNAFVQDSVVTSAEDLDLDASSTSVISSIVASASLGVGAGFSNGVGASLGVAQARNFIGDTVDGSGDALQIAAYLQDSTVTVASDITQDAFSQQSITSLVLSGSMALSAGTSGSGSLSGAGVNAENVVDVTTEAFIDGDGTGGVAGSTITLDAEDGSQIIAFAGAASVAASADLQGSVSLSLGVSLADNLIRSETLAYISNADTGVESTLGDVSVASSSTAGIQATAAALALSGSAGGYAGVSLAGAGAVANNVILTKTNAFIASSVVDSAVDVDITASNAAAIDALILAFSASVGAGAVGLTGAIGVAIAENLIGFSDADTVQAAEIKAYIDDASVTAAEALTLDADSTQQVSAVVLSGAVGVAIGGSAGSLNGAGADTINRIATEVVAQIDGDGANGIEADTISLTATDTSGIDAITGAIAAGFAFSPGISVTINIGVALAENEIRTAVDASIINADTGVSTTTGDVVLLAEQNSSIEAITAAAALGASIGGIASVSISGAGAMADNVILASTNSYVQNSIVDSAAGVDLDAMSAADIDATIAAFAFSASVGGTIAVGGSFGGSLARNLIGYSDASTRDGLEVRAWFDEAAVSADTTITLDASANQSIDATVVAGAVALAAGAIGVGGAIAGSQAINLIGADVEATISGDGSVIAPSIALTALDTSTIDAFAGTAAISASAGLLSGSIALGGALAQNTITNNVVAAIINSANSVTSTTGNVSLTATEDATILAESAAASLAAGAGLGSLSFSRAGATAENVIDAATEAYIDGSTVTSAADIELTATGGASIRADVISAADSFSAGVIAGAISIGRSEAVNRIGSSDGVSQVRAYVVDSKVNATSGELDITAIGLGEIDAIVSADATAWAAGAIAAAVSETGAAADNFFNTDVEAFVGTNNGDSASFDASINVGSLDINASDTAAASAEISATSVSSAGGGFSGSISVADSEADNEIANSVSAFTRDADINASGVITIDAIETSGSEAKSVASSQASSSGFSVSVSGGASNAGEGVTDFSLTRAFIGAGSDVTAGGDISVNATGDSFAVADADTGSSAGGLIAWADSSAVARAQVNPDVLAYIGEAGSGTVLVTGLSNVTVTADGSAEADANASSSSSGTVATGGSGAVATVDSDVRGYIDRDVTVIATGNVDVNAFVAPLSTAAGIDDLFSPTDVDLVNDTIDFSFPLSTGDAVQYLGPAINAPLESGRDYSVIDLSDSDNLIRFGAEFSGASVDAERDTITFENAHGFQTGDQVHYDLGGGTSIFADPTIDTTSDFRAVVIDSTTIKLVGPGDPLSPSPNTFTASDVDVDNDRLSLGITLTDGTALTYRAPTAASFAANLIDVSLSGDDIQVDDDGVIAQVDINNIFVEDHGFDSGSREAVIYETTGTEVDGLTAGQTYFVLVDSDNSFRLLSDETDDTSVVQIDESTDVFTEHTLRRLTELPIQTDTGGELVDGRTYYVTDFDSSDDSFQLLENLGDTTPIGLDLTADQSGSAANHSLTTEALDLVTVDGVAVQSIFIDLTGSGFGIQELRGPGGAELSDVSPPSGDGISSSVATGGGSGFGAFTSPNASTVVDYSALAWIAADATSGEATGVVAGGVSINADSEGAATSNGNNKGGGFVQEGRVDADTTYTNNARAFVGDPVDANGVVIDASGVEITVDGLFEMNATSDNLARGNARSDGGGFIGSAVAQNDLMLTSLTDSRVGSGANIVAESVRLNAQGNGSEADGAARGTTDGFYGYAAGRANVTHNATVAVQLNSGAVVRGEEGVDITVDQTGYTNREAGSRDCDCFISRGNTSDNNASGSSTTQVNALAGATIEVGARQAGTPLATSADLDRLALFVDAESTTDTPSINWNSDVVFLLGGSDLLLRVDDAGNVVEQENILDSEFNSTAIRLDTFALDANRDTTGQALFTGDDDVEMTGNAATFIYRNTWDSVTIIAEGDQQMSIGRITPYNDGTNPPADMQEDVRIDVIDDVLFSFAVEQSFEPTVIDIQSLGTGSPTGGEDLAVVIENIIDNPIGTTSITVGNGDVAGRFDEDPNGTIRTNILLMDVNGNVGPDSEFVEGPRRLEIELVNSEDRPTDVDVTAAGKVELDIRGLQREVTANPFVITGSNITAGEQVELRFFEGWEQTTLGADPDLFTIEVFETSRVAEPSGTPIGSTSGPDGGRTTEVTGRFRPTVEPPTPVDLPLGVFGTGTTELEVTYDFDLITSGRDIDITANGGDVPDNIEATDTLMNLVAGTNIVANADDGSLGNIDVSFNGNVTLTESEDDLRIGLVTTQGDVTLTATDGSIIDAPDGNDGTNTDSGDAAADVVGNNFNFMAPSGGIGSEANVFEIDSATETDGQLDASALDDIFITKLTGNMNIGVVTSESNATLLNLDGDMNVGLVQATFEANLTVLGGRMLDSSDSDTNNDSVTDVEAAQINLVVGTGAAGVFDGIGRQRMDGTPLRIETNLVPAIDFVADLNSDGSVNTLDIAVFQNSFVGNDLLADVNGDGSVNTLDIAAFQIAFRNLTFTESAAGLTAVADGSVLIAETEGTMFINEVTSNNAVVNLLVLDDAGDTNDLVLEFDGSPGSISANFGIILEAGDDILIPEGSTVSSGTGEITLSVDGETVDPDSEGSTVLVEGSVGDNVVLVVVGGEDEDTFDLTINSPFATLDVAGSDPAAPASPGDTLIVRSNSTATDTPGVNPGAGIISITGLGDIDYSGIETVTLDAPAPIAPFSRSLPIETPADEEPLVFDSSSGELRPLAQTSFAATSGNSDAEGDNGTGTWREWAVHRDEARLARSAKGLVRW